MTKTLQEVHLDKNIRLLDSPGVVFADAETAGAAALRNAMKIERLEAPGGWCVRACVRVWLCVCVTVCVCLLMPTLQGQLPYITR